ncbi:uncharacterized protein LOC129220359 [Uloborus diversus]|uniref:uncharacterized protein LOC129220359 n=1 Tax=Uloborus diversus TaxID=327109 RepID=UPI00240A1301|nr:uncharacterized protein LOC129220359 [Uloborus diversus]
MCSDRFHMDSSKNTHRKVKPCSIFTKDIGASFKVKHVPAQSSYSFTDLHDIILKKDTSTVPQKLNVECSVPFLQSGYFKRYEKKAKRHKIDSSFNVSDLSSNFSCLKEDVNVQSKSNLLSVALDRVKISDTSKTESDWLRLFPDKDSNRETKQFTSNSFKHTSRNLPICLENKDDRKQTEIAKCPWETVQNRIENTVKSNLASISTESFLNSDNFPENIDIQYPSSQSQSDCINDSEPDEVQSLGKTLSVTNDDDDYVNSGVVRSVASVNYSSTLNEMKIESEGKGSSWIHSLKWNEDTCVKDSVSKEEYNEKLKIKGFLSGGLAEKAVKLQRRIRSDKVIWDHKIHDVRNKACNKFLTLLILTVLHCGEIIVTKCSKYSNEENHELNVSSERSFQENELVENDDKLLHSNSFIILFKKNDFYKFKLKAKQIFRLFYPWEIMSVPSIQYPIILRTDYLEAMSPRNDDLSSALCLQSSKIENENLHEVMEYVLPEISRNVEFLDKLNHFGLGDTITSVSGRIQRIWQHQTSPKLQALTSNDYHTRFSVLLQTERNNFIIFKLMSSFENLQKTVTDFISYSEGNCYRFHDCQVTYKYSKHEYSSLFQILEYLLYTKSNTLEDALSLPDFCYELFSNSSFQEPDVVSAEHFPPYFDFEISPLALLLQSASSHLRFSCIAKVLCHINGIFYVTDETLLESKHVKYMRLQGCFNCRPSDSIVGSEVLIKEACFFENILLLDEFSRVIPLHDESKLLSDFLSRLNFISSISLSNLLSPLHEESKVEDLVTAEGVIVEVNENSALSWLECCYCHKENLLQDNNSVIYCEDCECVVSKPILNVKLEVIINCKALPDAVLVFVQLLPSTIKRMLNISEDTHQPQCRIGDVMHKGVNSLFCHVRHCEVKGKQKLFYLTEIS